MKKLRTKIETLQKGKTKEYTYEKKMKPLIPMIGIFLFVVFAINSVLCPVEHKVPFILACIVTAYATRLEISSRLKSEWLKKIFNKYKIKQNMTDDS